RSKRDWSSDVCSSDLRGDLFPVGSFGHTGFTGTSIWIDPFSKTYVILLTNAVHPAGEGNVVALRAQVADIAAAAFARAPTKEELDTRMSSTGYWEIVNSYCAEAAHSDNVQTGIDVLESENFAPL